LKNQRRITTIRSTWKVFFGRGIITQIAFFIIIIFILLAIFAPLITQDPLNQNLSKRFSMPSSEHLLGLDSFGRDILSRIIYGARISLTASMGSGLSAACIGIMLGLIAGYYEKIFGGFIMRAVDAQLSIPPLLLVMTVVTMLGNSVGSTIIAIGIGMIPTYVRMVYGMVLTLKENDYITAASLIGQKDWKILLMHLLPNCYPSIIVLFTMNLGNAILTEAGLSFIGIGIISPNISWGSMISEGYQYLTRVPLLSIIPGLCIMLVVVAFNFIGDGLRDALDPRLRGKL
jgi:ABC-type dipeptide/oligopeptide/nickel transport system permease subunit